MTTTQNLELVRGNTRTYTFTCKDEDGVVVDITGSKVWFTVKEDEDLDDAGDTQAVFQRKNATAGGSSGEVEMSDPTNGEFKVYVVGSNTASAEPGNYWFDAKVVTAAGNAYTVTKGRFKLKTDVTRTSV